MKSLIIHLKRATARASNVDKLLHRLPEAQVIDAVDGQDPEQIARIQHYAGGLYQPAYPFSLSKGEIACFLSHRHCWDMIARGDRPFGLVAEDDMVIDPVPFATALSLAQRYADEDSFIRFPTKMREHPAGAVARQDGAALFLPKTIGLQAVCQIVGRAAAKRLLAATQVIDRPIDTMMQMHWATGQPIHTVLPNGISDLGVASTIQSKTRTSDFLMREIRRAQYRVRIKLQPQHP